MSLKLLTKLINIIKMKNKYKNIVIILIILFIILMFICISKKTEQKTLKCTYEFENYAITHTINFLDDGIYIKIDNLYTYDNMDDVVDNFDSASSYLNILRKKTDIKTHIEQNQYQLNYSMSGYLTSFNNKDLVSEELNKLSTLKRLSQFKKYYKEIKYICN